MPTFLFWNVNRNRASVEDRVARLVRAHGVDVLILAEYPGDPTGLIARLTAAAGSRRLHGAEYPFFYNPMWGQFGDRTPGPPGTYYRSAGEQVNYYWNVYDQVLVRPALIRGLGAVVVLTDDGSESLLTRNGLPDARTASDHLPLLFTLDLDAGSP